MKNKPATSTSGPAVDRYPLKENRPPKASDSIKTATDSTPKKKRANKRTPQKANRTLVVKSKPTDILPGVQNRALSIRQPYVEMILCGTKTIEYRTMPTNIRGRVYIYASLTPGPLDYFEELNAKPGDFPTGVLVGTVEIVGCKKPLFEDEYHWLLDKPERLPEPIKAENKAQPSWFIPFKK